MEGMDLDEVVKLASESVLEELSQYPKHKSADIVDRLFPGRSLVFRMRVMEAVTQVLIQRKYYC